MTKYKDILETVGRTPVVRINRLGPAGVNLYVKIEAFNPLGSVKDRLALGVIEAAEKSGELKPGQTVIEAELHLQMGITPLRNISHRTLKISRESRKSSGIHFIFRMQAARITPIR